MSLEVHEPSWYHRKHHDSSGSFYNLQDTAGPGLLEQGNRLLSRARGPRYDQQIAPVVQPDLDALHASPESVRITWLGHSSVLLQTPDAAVLVDPVFSERLGPATLWGMQRLAPLPLTYGDLPHIDIVLISHDHYDHLDRATVEQLSQLYEPCFFVPLGAEKHLRRWGIPQVIELDWWQFVATAAIRFNCTPARHSSGRGLLDRNKTLWCGWHIQPLSHNRPSVFYAGDTGYGDHFRNLRLYLGPPEVAILPCAPLLENPAGNSCMTPNEACQAFVDLQSDVLLPVHWGTFQVNNPSDAHPMEALQSYAARTPASSPLVQLSAGESYEP